MKVLFSHINSSILFSQNDSGYRFLMPLTVPLANLGVNKEETGGKQARDH